MRSCIVFILLTISIASYAQNSSHKIDAPYQIDVVTYNERPAVNIDYALDLEITVKVHNFDTQSNMQDELSKDLPNDEEKATAIAKERIKNIKPERWNHIWNAALMAKKYDLKKAPAIIFNNGEAVIYGITDLQIAMKHWQSYKSR